MRERECLGQIEAAHDWLNGKERHHRLELLQDHKAEIPSTGTQYAKNQDKKQIIDRDPQYSDTKVIRHGV